MKRSDFLKTALGVLTGAALGIVGGGKAAKAAKGGVPSFLTVAELATIARINAQYAEENAWAAAEVPSQPLVALPLPAWEVAQIEAAATEAEFRAEYDQMVDHQMDAYRYWASSPSPRADKSLVTRSPFTEMDGTPVDGVRWTHPTAGRINREFIAGVVEPSAPPPSSKDFARCIDALMDRNRPV